MSRSYVLKKDFNDPIVILIDDILCRAIKVGASDIHFEVTPAPSFLRVRYRIDGILYDQEPVMSDQSLPVLSRIKVLSSIDIAQRRVPQDGKFIVNFSSRNIDLRVSTFPSVYGEKIVVRILDRHLKDISLSSLGCSQNLLNRVKKVITKSHGFFLVTGPTGSGKTTTLYAILSKLNDPKINIVTLEDPVEYHINGITQSQINPKSGFTFESGLRSMLRQDPDVVMVGEIRDRQTAQIAIEAALTGHLVLSTLHTNDSVSAITRLIDMGIEPFLVSACLTGVLAQRLVRKLCNFCKFEKEDKTFFSKGCKYCFGLGHRGRTGIFEFLDIDEKIRRLIIERADSSKILSHSTKKGMTFLSDDALEKSRAGVIL